MAHDSIRTIRKGCWKYFERDCVDYGPACHRNRSQSSSAQECDIDHERCRVPQPDTVDDHARSAKGHCRILGEARACQSEIQRCALNSRRGRDAGQSRSAKAGCRLCEKKGENEKYFLETFNHNELLQTRRLTRGDDVHIHSLFGRF